MTFYEISQALDNPCFPYGDTNIDKERYEIMKNKIDIVDELIQDIENAGEFYKRKEYSISQIANLSNRYLCGLRDYLNEIEYLPKGENE